MLINPYGDEPVRLAVDLANDRPSNLASLVQRCTDAGLLIDFPVVESDYAATMDFIDRWSRVARALTPNERAHHLNALLARHVSHPRLTDHSDEGWHLHYRDDDHTLAGVLATLMCVGTAFHLVGRGMDRLGECAADDCHLLYADLSRNGRQRYCSPRCGSREAVRRHRARETPVRNGRR